jgi:hypothetical protein
MEGDLVRFHDVDAAVAAAAVELDALIDRYLVALERRMRHDIAATGPEDQDALDRPPDPRLPWSRVTVEEAVLGERATLMAWRDRTLNTIRSIASR